MAAAMHRVFVSYRRADAEAEAGRIADRLRVEFGDDEVFFDTASLEGGDLWRERIRQALAEARVMIVVIGPAWLRAADEGGQPRLGRDGDVVTEEIEHGLQQRLRVIPVLVRQAAPPRPGELPPPLRALLGSNVCRVESATFDRDMGQVLAALGRGSRWKRRVTLALAASLSIGGVTVALSLRLGGPATTTTPPPPPVLQLDVTLAAAADDPRSAPEMKLWHRRPSPGEAANINLLDQPRQVGAGVWEYRSPLPLMPSDGQRYGGLLHRVMQTASQASPPTEVCFVARRQLAADATTLRLDCAEGGACRVAAGVAPAASCDAATARAGFVVAPAYAAAVPGPAVWAVPSLATLQSPANPGRAYSELRVTSAALPALQAANRLVWGITINGQPVHIDGLPPEAYPQPFDAARGLDLHFALENLDADGRVQGHEDLRLDLEFRAGTRPVGRQVLALPFVALRTLPPQAARLGDVPVHWQADYHPGRAEDVHQIFIASSPDVAEMETLKARIGGAEWPVPDATGRARQPLVAVLRPPVPGNARYGLNAGLRLANGQVRFTFDEAASVALCRALVDLAARRPGLMRADAYRRRVDSRADTVACTELARR